MWIRTASNLFGIMLKKSIKYCVIVDLIFQLFICSNTWSNWHTEKLSLVVFSQQSVPVCGGNSPLFQPRISWWHITQKMNQEKIHYFPLSCNILSRVILRLCSFTSSRAHFFQCYVLKHYQIALTFFVWTKQTHPPHPQRTQLLNDLLQILLSLWFCKGNREGEKSKVMGSLWKGHFWGEEVVTVIECVSWW